MITSTCRIRTARPDDLDALMVLEQGFDADRISRRSMRRLLQRPSALIRVIDADTDHPTLVATLILLTRSNSRAARIYSLIVDTTQRFVGPFDVNLIALWKHAKCHFDRIRDIVTAQPNS